MMKSILFLISFSVLLIGNLESSVASGSSSTHPHTNALELKPASLDNSFKTASVCFMGFGDCDPNAGFGKGDDYSVNTANQCKNEGFIQLNCNSVQQGDGVCPYNPAYGKGCKCRPGLVSCANGQEGVGSACNGQYASCQCKTSLVACAANQNGNGAYCGGKYESCSCKPEYQYNSSNCTSPRSLGGATCGGKYTNCTCPSGVSAGAYGCKTYYGSPCGSVCQVAYSDNCRNRSSVATPYGCLSYFADCGSACERAYGDNCRNRSDTYAPYGCQQAWADCSSKCEIPFGDNCRNRTAVATPYGCQQAWADCGSKCQVAKGNPDCDVTSQSCPNGCQTTNSCGKCTSCNMDTDTICKNNGFSSNYFCSVSEGMDTIRCPENDKYARCVFSCSVYKKYIDETLAKYEDMSKNSYAATCGKNMKLCDTKMVWPEEFCADSRKALSNKVTDYKTKCGSYIMFMFNCPKTSCRDGQLGIDMCGSGIR